MRVLMLGWEYPPRVTGGLGTATAGIARGLAAAGVEIALALPESAGSNASPGIALELLAIGSAPSSYASAGDPYGGDLFALVERYAQAIVPRAARADFELVHAHDWMTWPAALAARDVSGRPFVAHVHSLELDRQPLAPSAAIEEVERRALHAADRVICVSAYTSERVQRRHGLSPAKIRVVHNAVEPAPECTSSERPSGPPLVLFLGRVTRQKGPAAFLRAAAGVLELEPATHFVLAGVGDELDAMKALASELGLAQRVRFPGFVPPEEREALFARATAFVMPSVSEPFGIVPLEALAAGVPVIVSRHSGVAEVLKSCLAVDAWSTDALVEAIVALLRHPALRRQLVEDGRRELGGMQWETRGAELVRVYGELLAESA